MKIDIIIVYMPRYEQGHEKNFVPPVTGIHLAALTPTRYEGRVIHQQVGVGRSGDGGRGGGPLFFQRLCPGNVPAGSGIQATGKAGGSRRTAFSPGHTTRRITRGSRYLRPGAWLLLLLMNGFYGGKRLWGNEPIDMALRLPGVAFQPGAQRATASVHHHCSKSRFIFGVQSCALLPNSAPKVKLWTPFA